MRTKGFTLIELLIVVAIIAILAAIAIPNFLQAQVRAKVSRAQADMRTIATALESYYVDHNSYPPCGYGGIPPVGHHWLNYTITTPIAYLTTSNLEDPFFAGVEDWDFDNNPHWRNFRYVNYYTTYVDILGNEGAYGRYGRIYGQWALFSRGPVSQFSFQIYTLQHESGDDLWLSAQPYDPTNGTVSAGDIVRTQLGPEPNYGSVNFQ